MSHEPWHHKLWEMLWKNGEKLLFRAIGLGAFAFSVWFLLKENVILLTTTLAVGFFAFIYANFTKFKKFKGLGVEAELWEDKQKEAENLVEKLHSVLALTSDELLRLKLTQIRTSGSADKVRLLSEWWSLYKAVSAESSSLKFGHRLTDFKSEYEDQLLRLLAKGFYESMRSRLERPIVDHALKEMSSNEVQVREELRQSIHSRPSAFIDKAVSKRTAAVELSDIETKLSAALREKLDTDLILSEFHRPQHALLAKAENFPRGSVDQELIEEILSLLA